MRIYLAAPFPMKDRMKIYASALKDDGHEVTAEWIDSPAIDNGVDRVTPFTAPGDRLWSDTALRNIEDSDVVFFFSEDPGSIYSRGGRHVEFGYALAKRKPIVSIGSMENIFHTQPNVFVKRTFAEAVKLLDSILEDRDPLCFMEANY